MLKSIYSCFNNNKKKLNPKKYCLIYIINKLFSKKLVFSNSILKYYNNILKYKKKINFSLSYNYFLINLSFFILYLPFNFKLKINLWIYIIYFKYIIYIHNYFYNIYLCTKGILQKFPLINLILKFININRYNKLNNLKINKYSKNYIHNNLIIYDINKTLYKNFQIIIFSKKLLFINIKYLKYLILINNSFLKYYYLTFNKYFNIKYLLKVYNTIGLINYYYLNNLNNKIYITNIYAFYLQLNIYNYNINYFIYNLKIQNKFNSINLIKINNIFYKTIINKNKIIKVFIWYQIKTLIILFYYRRTFFKLTKINYPKKKSIKNLYTVLKFYNLIFCPLDFNLFRNYLNNLKIITNNLYLNNIIKSIRYINIINIINNILIENLIKFSYKNIKNYFKIIYLLFNNYKLLNNRYIILSNKEIKIYNKLENYNYLLNNNVFKYIYLINNKKYTWKFEKNLIINIYLKILNYVLMFLLIITKDIKFI